MAQFTKLTAIAAPIEAPNVDTDQIIPARFIKYPRAGGYGQFLFRDQRLREDGGEIAGFILNQAPFRDARILVVNKNFGCGSSREGAVYALYDFGIRAIVGPSFGDIFFNNCLKNGIVPARLTEADCAALRAAVTAHPGTTITVDLERNRVEGAEISRDFAIDDFWRQALLKGLDELGLTMEEMPAIEEFETRRRALEPWAVR